MGQTRDIQGTIAIIDLDDESVTFELKGFSVPSNGLYHYEIAIGTNLLAPWVNIGKRTVYFQDGLKPNTKYTIWAKLVRDYGEISTANPNKFMTEDGNASVYVQDEKLNWIKGQVYVQDVNLNWAKAKKIFVYQNGKWISN